MSWIICGEDKLGNPFPFEANSVKGSCRNALGNLLETIDLPDTEDVLRARHHQQIDPGLGHGGFRPGYALLVLLQRERQPKR